MDNYSHTIHITQQIRKTKKYLRKLSRKPRRITAEYARPTFLRDLFMLDDCRSALICVFCWQPAQGWRNFLQPMPWAEVWRHTCYSSPHSIPPLLDADWMWAESRADLSRVTRVKGIIRVSKLQGIDLFYCLLDLRELANSNDMHKSLVGALFWKK